MDAYAICNEAFQQSAYYETCLQIVPNFSNETLVNCINDLVVSFMTMDYGLVLLTLSVIVKAIKCFNTNA